ncbi:GntR family transcriptional regulator [Bacillus horti]|uniref:DNA-binding transcriptional regulator YhcF (GntR family) n=1 Tax=Caldalkalibacillus horti TaxID=77523 RepID=A0ABT9VYY6_9BACI|nr:GntR family transcriptional regulator [Bacillus horti]MDQ0166207.1 DNA-binding transcriptional regulator YhcF (GntR family) [Bacillus horti]
MSQLKDNGKPLFIQVRELIEDQIVNGHLKEEEQAPSTNQLVQFYKINHATVSKGVNQLVEQEILYKKRGIGMFVNTGAKEKLMKKRKQAFIENDLIQVLLEADKLGISEEELFSLIKQLKERRG